MNKDQNYNKENDLMRSLAKGEKKAFQTIYANCHSLVTRSILNMSGQHDDAEDIFHSALLVLYSKSKDPEFRLNCKISTFLVAIARKKWLKELEQKKRLSEKEINYALVHKNEKAEALIDWKEIVDNEQKRKKLHRSLEKLGSPCKELIVSFYIEDLNMKELAKKFDYTNANNAKTQKHKCLQRLKKIFFNL